MKKTKIRAGEYTVDGQDGHVYRIERVNSKTWSVTNAGTINFDSKTMKGALARIERIEAAKTEEKKGCEGCGAKFDADSRRIRFGLCFFCKKHKNEQEEEIETVVQVLDHDPEEVAKSIAGNVGTCAHSFCDNDPMENHLSGLCGTCLANSGILKMQDGCGVMYLDRKDTGFQFLPSDVEQMEEDAAPANFVKEAHDPFTYTMYIPRGRAMMIIEKVKKEMEDRRKREKRESYEGQEEVEAAFGLPPIKKDPVQIETEAKPRRQMAEIEHPTKELNQMKIKICKENESKINKSCKIPRAKERTCDYTDVLKLVNHTEDHLKAYLVPKKDWQGCKAYYSESVSCNSYGYYFAQSTQITVTRGAKDWFLTNVKRVKKGTRNGIEEYNFNPTAKAVDAMIKKQTSEFYKL